MNPCRERTCMPGSKVVPYGKISKKFTKLELNPYLGVRSLLDGSESTLFLPGSILNLGVGFVWFCGGRVKEGKFKYFT